MGLFDFFKPTAGQISDKLDKLVSEAKWGTNEGAKAKAATEIGKILAGITDVDFLHAIYEKQPYKEEMTKQLVLRRYHEIIDGMTDIHELLKYANNNYTHNFSNAASLSIAQLTSRIEDENLLREIVKGNSGFDHRAKDIAKLRLNYKTVSTKELMEIAKGNKASTEFHAQRAADMLNDLSALEELAFDNSNFKSVVAIAQIKLFQMTKDTALLKRIQAKTDNPTFQKMVGQRIAELT